MLDSAHRGDGLVDLAFVATDYGSANTAATGIGGVVVPSPKREPEGAVFVLVNKGDGSLLRNARRLTEPGAFGQPKFFCRRTRIRVMCAH